MTHPHEAESERRDLEALRSELSCIQHASKVSPFGMTRYMKIRMPSTTNRWPNMPTHGCRRGRGRTRAGVGRIPPRVRSDFKSGVRSGVNGTPTFFINSARFEGDWQNVEEFAQALQGALVG